MESELREAVLAASTRADVCAAIEGIYSVLAEAIAIRRPICNTSGRCCRFEEFGHRLYVSTIELAKFMADLSVAPAQSSVLEEKVGGESSVHRLPILTIAKERPASDPRGCPFQVEGLCGVHAIRPFGCRIFFCDETSTAWQHETYERLHGQIRRLHDELAVPYYYVEWRFALSALRLSKHSI